MKQIPLDIHQSRFLYRESGRRNYGPESYNTFAILSGVIHLDGLG
jgi:hypothetical protein